METLVNYIVPDGVLSGASIATVFVILAGIELLFNLIGMVSDR